MTTETYRGYELKITEPSLNPNGQTTQTVLIYKDGHFIGDSYADVQFENAILKAKKKVDNKILK